MRDPDRTARENAQEEEKGSFFERLKKGLKKTRNNIVSGLENVFLDYEVIDDDFYEELTEVLDRLQESTRGVKSTASWYRQIEEYETLLLQEARKQDQRPQGVVLSTLHAAKGLEFDSVYILNVNEGCIPYRKAVLEDAMEEERRLFYVGMTRARKELSLCFVRRIRDAKKEPSRFLLEAGYKETSKS